MNKDCEKDAINKECLTESW